MGANSKNPLALTVLAVAMFSAPAYVAQAQDATRIEGSLSAGIAARDAGRFAEAEILFRDVVERDPDNVDARLLLALVVAYQERYGEALAILTPAVRREPTRPDLLIAKARMLAWSGERREASEIVAAVLGREPQNAEALALREWLDATQPTEERPTTVYVSGSRSDFERSSLDPWYEGLAGVWHRVDDHWIVGGEFLKSRRYGLDDENVALSAVYRFDEASGVDARIEVTPGADFLPKWGLAAGGDVRIFAGSENGWIGPAVLTLDARHRRYQSVKVNNLDPGVVQYFADGQAWVSLQKKLVWDSAVDAVDHGWSVRLDVDFAKFAPVRGYVVRAESPENDLGVPVTTKTVASGAIVDVTDRFGVRLDYTQEDRSGSFQRDEVSIGAFFKY